MNKINVKEPLTTAMLTAAPMQEQKQMLGERLFPLIQVVNSPKMLIIRRILDGPNNIDLCLPLAPACRPSWKDHWDAAGDRQLRAPSHA